MENIKVKALNLEAQKSTILTNDAGKEFTKSVELYVFEVEGVADYQFATLSELNASNAYLATLGTESEKIEINNFVISEINKLLKK